MTFEQLIAIVRGYQAGKPREEVRSAVECLVNGGVSLGMLALPGVSVDVDAVLALAASGKPVSAADIGALLRPVLAPRDRRKREPRPAAKAAPCLPLDPAPAESIPTLPRAPAGRAGPALLSPSDKHLLHESAKAKRLLRAPLRRGPKLGATIEAAAAAAGIPENALLEAADTLEIRSKQGLWWLPE